jgi:hypothetical protein
MNVRNGWKSASGCGTLSSMSTGVRERPYSTGERVALLVTRVLTATVLTALIGAIANGFYERFFAPDLYAAGPPLGRGLFRLTMTIPFILVGLILLGLPTAYALARKRAESAFAYALVGTGAGALLGKVAFGFLTTHGYAICAFYGCVCAVFWWWLRPVRNGSKADLRLDL